MPTSARARHHLACAAQQLQYMLRHPLALAAVEIPESGALEQATERARAVVDVAEEAPASAR